MRRWRRWAKALQCWVPPLLWDADLRMCGRCRLLRGMRRLLERAAHWCGIRSPKRGLNAGVGHAP